MATLLELTTIEANSQLDPGEPPNAAIVAARDLRAKVRSAVMRRSGIIMGTALPTPGQDGREDAIELLGWAQQAVRNPDSATGEVFRLALGRAPSGSSVAAILATADANIESGVLLIVPLLAKGRRPG